MTHDNDRLDAPSHRVALPEGEGGYRLDPSPRPDSAAAAADAFRQARVAPRGRRYTWWVLRASEFYCEPEDRTVQDDAAWMLSNPRANSTDGMNHPPLPPTPSGAAARFRNNGRAPLYQELARWLERKVRSGEYPKGSRIPGDKKLATELGVSVITVRAAMRELRDQHLIERYPGKGTFVVDRVDRSVWGFGSTDELLAMGHQTSIKLLRSGHVVPPDLVSERLGLGPGKKVFWCQTLRFSNGQPFELTDVYLPPITGEQIAKIDLAAALEKSRLVSAVVQEVCGIGIAEVRQTMGAELARDREAKLLKVPTGMPLLTVERDHYSADGTLLQAGQSLHRVDRFRYTTNLKRVPGLSA